MSSSKGEDIPLRTLQVNEVPSVSVYLMELFPIIEKDCLFEGNKKKTISRVERFYRAS